MQESEKIYFECASPKHKPVLVGFDMDEAFEEIKNTGYPLCPFCQERSMRPKKMPSAYPDNQPDFSTDDVQNKKNGTLEDLEEGGNGPATEMWYETKDMGFAAALLTLGLTIRSHYWTTPPSGVKDVMMWEFNISEEEGNVLFNEYMGGTLQGSLRKFSSSLHSLRQMLGSYYG